MNDSVKSGFTIRTAALLAYSVGFTGIVLILVSVLGAERWSWADWVAAFVRELGLLLSAVMAGTIIHEKFLRDEMIGEVGNELDKRIASNMPAIGRELSQQITNRISDIGSALDEKIEINIPNMVRQLDKIIPTHIPEIGNNLDTILDNRIADIGTEVDQRLIARIPKVDVLADATAESVHKLFCERPPGMTGIRLVNKVRRNFDGYYSWVIEQKAQELFFAGRSVLHRIDADIFTRIEGKSEDILFRKLKEGSKIKILFIDPRIDIIERLAKEENQTPDELLGDVTTSIGICKRLYDLINNNLNILQPSAELSIRVYDRVPYFAYHRQDNEVTVGFYFQSVKGSTSAAYEIVDEITTQVFEEHFDRIMTDAFRETLVNYDGARGRAFFNEELFHNLRQFLVGKLGESSTDELLNLNRSLSVRRNQI